MYDRLTADAFLRSVRDAKIEARRCEHRLEELRAQCERVVANYGPFLPGGGSDGHRDSIWVTAAEQGERLLRRQEAYLRRIDQVEAFIEELPDARHRTILRLRYVDCRRWDAVQQGLREYGLWYEERNVYKLHGAALLSARRCWDGWLERHPEVAGALADEE